jgi:hypothetical protein
MEPPTETSTSATNSLANSIGPSVDVSAITTPHLSIGMIGRMTATKMRNAHLAAKANGIDDHTAERMSR